MPVDKHRLNRIRRAVERRESFAAIGRDEGITPQRVQQLYQQSLKPAPVKMADARLGTKVSECAIPAALVRALNNAKLFTWLNVYTKSPDALARIPGIGPRSVKVLNRWRSRIADNGLQHK